MNEPFQYQIGIIGGGLAGLCLSIQAANAGFKTILFEKEAYPFHKVCGEYISMESFPFLERLGLPINEWNLPFIKRLEVSAPNGKVHQFPLPLGGFGVSRHFLDHQLYQLALKKGVTILTNTRVLHAHFMDDRFDIQTDRGAYYAAFVAGSFGKRSNIDIKLNRTFIQEKTKSLNNYIGVKYHINYPHQEDLISLHNFKNGYCGISKIEDNKSCLCYLTTAQNLHACNNQIKILEEKILFKNPRLEQIFKEAHFHFKKPLTISQVSFQEKSSVENHLILLGDAAGLITPLCGNGMSMAMHSSKILFELIQKYFTNVLGRQELELAYQSTWHAQFASRLKMGRIIQRFFGNEQMTGIFLNMMSHLPVIGNKVIASTHGRPY